MQKGRLKLKNAAIFSKILQIHANTMQTSQNIMQHEKVFQMSQRPCKVRGSIPTDLLVFTAKPQA
jgi:hypothetical protein